LNPDIKQIAMAYFGVQYSDASGEAIARETVRRWRRLAERQNGPAHFDVAHYVDEAGYDTLVMISYWSRPADFRKWLDDPSLADWWDSPDRLHDGVGWFREIVCPKVERIEAIFSGTSRLEGFGVLGGFSAPIQEKGYWGSMRDRFPIAQTDLLEAPEMPSVLPVQDARIRISGSDNLAMIRSGQDWSETTGTERQVYLEEIEPILREGMDFLRDNGGPIGCIANRYMTHVDLEFEATEKSFGMSWWESLGHLERWSESHPTHLAIFGSFMRMVKRLNFQIELRLYHEVTVTPRSDQEFEYIACHSRTGLLRVEPSPVPLKSVRKP
jgi:aldoxime dehydratase